MPPGSLMVLMTRSDTGSTWKAPGGPVCPAPMVAANQTSWSPTVTWPPPPTLSRVASPVSGSKRTRGVHEQLPETHTLPSPKASHRNGKPPARTDLDVATTFPVSGSTLTTASERTSGRVGDGEIGETEDRWDGSARGCPRKPPNSKN